MTWLLPQWLMGVTSEQCLMCMSALRGVSEPSLGRLRVGWGHHQVKGEAACSQRSAALHTMTRDPRSRGFPITDALSSQAPTAGHLTHRV